jgi:uncharacterized membrane protein YdbT with pleckstrin-like domain
MAGELALELAMWGVAVLLWTGVLWFVGAVLIHLYMMWKGD